ncbi:hypothetical protein L1987_51377 [Smallanthus sonchifolius]|uniref:Uncharacterized protein n=1 Tax=Smallanthus sonchifolius TaxID=185202 RepID=A0ACB9EPH7_9ASTR|nr:hypothetical protein L1987_51377 [Smallanthus sonchifolius]
MLTSTPEFQYPSLRRLKDIAPPPLTLSTIPKPSILPKPQPPLDTNRFISKSPVTDYFGSLSPLGLTSSPAPPCFDPFGLLLSPLGLNMSPSLTSFGENIAPD